METPQTEHGAPAGIYPILRLLAALLLITLGSSAMYAVTVALKPVAQEFGANRGSASIPYMAFMLGFGLGGVYMGRLADRFGVLTPAVVGSIAMPASFLIAARATSLWQFCAIQGVVAGFLGASTTFVPLVSDISHWFERRRGLALAIVISGNYVAGAIWPPVLQRFLDSHGWRDTFFGVGVFTLCTMLPLCALFRRPPPALRGPLVTGDSDGFRRPLGFTPAALQRILCAAGMGCCLAMAMPQVHIVAYATDLGHPAARGAEMLSLMLGSGIVSRLVSGWISDRIGGIRALLLGSALQGLVLVAYTVSDTLTALYAASIAFGLAQGGIVPSYTVIIRAFFPPGEAGWRIGLTMLFTMVGMALGGWMAGVLFDLTGSYTASFVNSVFFNVVHMSLAAVLLQRSRAGTRGIPTLQQA